MVIHKGQIRDFCHHAWKVNGGLPQISYAVIPTSEELQIACWNFKLGVCLILWTPCPLNLSAEIKVATNEALLRFPKDGIWADWVESISPETFLRWQESFLIDPDTSGKFLFNDQAAPSYDHLCVQARRLWIELATSDLGSIASIRANVKQMKDWMNSAITTEISNIRSVTQWFEWLRDKESKLEQANTRIETYLNNIKKIWKTMEERVPFLWINEMTIFDNLGLRGAKIWESFSLSI